MRMKTLTALVTLGLAGVAAQAQAMDDRWYLAPSATYVITDSDRRDDDGWGIGLAAGKALNEKWNAEFSGRYLDLGDNDELFSFGLDGLYFLNRNPAFAPYLVGGLGYARDTSDNNLMANGGVGFMRQLSENIDLRADARYHWHTNEKDAYDDSGLGDWLISVGLNIALGQKAPPPAPVVKEEPKPAPVVEPPKPVDSDGDGVTDDKDKCPNTPAGRKVNAEGCELDSDGDGVVDALDKCPNTAAGRKVNAEGCELDGDKDGVVDALDQCPTTPAGRKVNAEGCELDGDKDGIVDGLDQCPDTPAGDKVDNKGCTLLNTIVLKGVNFDNDSAVLSADAMAILDNEVGTFKRYPALKVEVAGHTDSSNSDAYNQSLSERRAKAVMEYFISKGATAEQLTAKGYGESQPVADNGTAEGRAQNRRVELRILN
jgi:OOP family OmpA-OmpF porin